MALVFSNLDIHKNMNEAESFSSHLRSIEMDNIDLESQLGEALLIPRYDLIDNERNHALEKIKKLLVKEYCG